MSAAGFQFNRVGHSRPCCNSCISQVNSYAPISWPVPPARGATGPFIPRWSSERAARGLVITHARRKWYAIFEPADARGVYRVWDQVKQLVSGQSNALHKGFASEAAALEWLSLLDIHSKQQNEALEHLRQMVLGPGYRRGSLAMLASDGCRSSAADTLSGSLCGPSPDDLAPAPTPTAPRPWETSPIILSLPTAPTREYYRKWYAVRFVEGGSPGVYNTWQEAEAAIDGRYAEHRSFDSQAEALAYAFGPGYADQLLPAIAPGGPQLQHQDLQTDAAAEALGASVASDLVAAHHLYYSPSGPPDTEQQQDWSPQERSHCWEGSHALDGCSSDGSSGAGPAADFLADAMFARAGVASVRTMALAAGDAGTARLPPVYPGGKASAAPRQTSREIPSSTGGLAGTASSCGSRGVGRPAPAPAAMTAPLSYEAPYGRPAAAMTLTSGAVSPSPAAMLAAPTSAPSSAFIFQPCRAALQWIPGTDRPGEPYTRALSCFPSSAAPGTNSQTSGNGSAETPLLASGNGHVSGPLDQPAARRDPDRNVDSTESSVLGGGFGPGATSRREGSQSGGEAASSSGAGVGPVVTAAGGLGPAAAAHTSMPPAPQEQVGPLKRGRGRPRKAAVPQLPAGVGGTAAGDGGGAALEKPKRPRGRPPKPKPVEAVAVAEEPKRKRGRPRKVVA